MNIWIILLCVLLFLIVVIMIILTTDNTPIIPIIKNKHPLKCCILLTMYVKNRENLYTNIVNRWLNETNLDIYIVDSSNKGISINHPRLFQYKFEQLENFAVKNPSIYEVNSILEAIRHFNFKNYDMVIKITGKYFIPQLETCIDYLPKSDIILQYRTDTNGQNTEILAIKPSLIYDVISGYRNNQSCLENFICNIKNNYNSYRFYSFKLDSLVKRSDGSVLNFL